MSFRALAALAAVMCAGSGCVEIEQELRMNHDGSGKIVEKIALSPRGVRLMEAAARNPGAGNAITASQPASPRAP